MASRRSFIRGIGLMGVSLKWMDLVRDTSNRIRYSGNIDWEAVRKEFPITSWDKIHFNSGSAGVMPKVVSDHLIELIKYVNSKAPYEVWGEWQDVKADNLNRISKMVECDADELQIVRNTTEALNMIIYGLPLNPADEVIISAHDYPFAINAWKNRAEREGIILKELDITLPQGDEGIIQKFKAAISSKTKAIHITHITHREGHIMPVKALAELAAQNGASSIVDGAHCVGHIDLDFRKLGFDYFASSLHKWLNAPHGTGLIFAKKDKIGNLYNHPSSYLNAKDSMDKFEHIGTRAWSNEIGISAALDFHEMIGMKEKIRRLQELKLYWTNKVIKFKNVSFQTDVSSRFSGAVTTFKIKDLSGGQIVKILDKDYNIHAKSVGGKWGSGVRISVNIFTSIDELDQLVQAIKNIA